MQGSSNKSVDFSLFRALSIALETHSQNSGSCTRRNGGQRCRSTLPGHGNQMVLLDGGGDSCWRRNGLVPCQLKVWKGTNKLPESVPSGEWGKQCCYMGSVDPQSLQVPVQGIRERGCYKTTLPGGTRSGS